MRNLLVGILLGASLFAQSQEKPKQKVPEAEPLTTVGTYIDSSARTQVSAIEIDGDGGKLVVRIKTDGSVEYGEGFKADTAAKKFWEEISKAYPQVCDNRPKAKEGASHD